MVHLEERQPCNCVRLLLKLKRVTERESAISSRSALREYSWACLCATVRLIPQRVPISTQCRTAIQ
jgi:hypothetical protein